MTEKQKETIRFYVTNDFLLINGLLWGEDEKYIDEVINAINQDGRAVMKEALEQGPDKRWGCSKEEGERLLKIYEKRFPIIGSKKIKKEIIKRAKDDISNMMSAMKPLKSDMVLYRNIKNRFVSNLKEGQIINYLGFSSCSLNPHVPDKKMYGASDNVLLEINVPAGTLAIRLDLMPNVRNEPDEVILAPMKFLITKIDKENNKIYMKCKQHF